LAVKLRLRRMGKKRQPVYKVIAADSRSPRDGKFLEAIGLYNPKANPVTIDIKEDRALYWLSVGAQPTDTVNSLLRTQGINLKHNLLKSGANSEEIDTAMENWKKLKEVSAAKKLSKKEKKKETGTTEVKGAASEEKVEQPA